MKTYTKQELQAEAIAAARRHGVDPVFYVAQIGQESGWDVNAKGPKTRSGERATGLAQFMPGTAKGFKIDPLDPIQSLDAGAKYMAQLVKQFGSEDLARQAYNWGPRNLQKHLADPEKFPLPKETAEYNKKIYARAGATPNWGNETRMAAAPKPMTTKEAATLAMAEMNQGLPPGTLGQQQPVAALPDFGGGVAAAPQDDWRQRLSQMSAPQSLQPVALAQGGEDPAAFFEKIQDEATQVQNRTLNKMFADMGAQDTPEGPTLPSSIDRYLDKLLA